MMENTTQKPMNASTKITKKQAKEDFKTAIKVCLSKGYFYEDLCKIFAETLNEYAAEVNSVKKCAQVSEVS